MKSQVVNRWSNWYFVLGPMKTWRDPWALLHRSEAKKRSRNFECDLCLLTWVFFSSWIDIRKHFGKKRGTLWWFGVAMIMIVTTQDGWQPCVVLYRTGICHHHAAIFHHLKLKEAKYPNGCGGKEIQIWCWGFTIHLSIHRPFESETIYIMVVNGGVNLCWSAGYYNLQKAPYCNNTCGEYLPKKLQQTKKHWPILAEHVRRLLRSQDMLVQHLWHLSWLHGQKHCPVLRQFPVHENVEHNESLC